MKFKCPYCRKTFGPEPRATCPHCGRGMMLPDALAKKKLKGRGAGAVRARVGLADDENEPVVARYLHGTRAMAIIGLALLIGAGAMLLMRANTEVKTPIARKREDVALKEVRNLRVALELFKDNCGRYPTTNEGLMALVDDPGTVTNWGHNYIRLLKSDPWANRYVYGLDDSAPSVFSKGPDGIAGNADDVLPVGWDTVYTNAVDILARQPKP